MSPSSFPSQLFCRLMIKQAVRVIEDCYDIGAFKEIAQLYGGYTNSSFKITTQTGNRFHKYLLRIYRPGTPVEHICFEHSLIEHIVANGGHMVAALVRTREGANFARRPAPNADTSEDLLYSVFEFIGGEDKYSWTSNRLSDEEYTYSGRMLADLHNCAADFDPGPLESLHQPILKRLSALPANLDRCAERAQKSCFDQYFLKNLPDILNISQRTHDQLTQATDLPIIGIHGDFHPGNQKYNLNRVIGVFDFDRACLDLRLFDVALAVIYFCSCWEANTDGSLWLRKTPLFLRAYQKGACRSNNPGPLTTEECDFFFPMLIAANLSLIKWATDETYYLERENCPDKEYLYYLKHHVRLMRWLEKNRSKVERILQKALFPY